MEMRIMGKRPAFYFFPGDWRRDTQVQMASFETRGVWFEMLCCMFDAPERGTLKGEPEELSRLIGCDTETFNKSLEEIKRLIIADVTESHGIVTIVNRRMDKEHKATVNSRMRKRKQRGEQDCHTDVTLASSKASNNTKDSNTKLKENIKKDYTETFILFWEVYPRKIKKEQALKAWIKIKPDKKLAWNIIEAVGEQCSAGMLNLTEDMKYCPHASTWLNQKQWLDEVESPEKDTPVPGKPKPPEQDIEGYRQHLLKTQPRANDWFLKSVLPALKDDLTDESYKAFIEPLVVVSASEKRVEIFCCPETVAWVIEHYLEQILNAVHNASPKTKDCGVGLTFKIPKEFVKNALVP